MPQIHQLVPPRGAALLAILPVVLVSATVLGAVQPASRHLPLGASGARRPLTRTAGSHPVAAGMQPAPAPLKASATPPAPAAGAYPYPLDAMGQVAVGQLVLDPGGSGSTGEGSIRVEIPPAGWVPGQKVFLFLGRKFLLVSSPGAQVVIDATGSAGLTLSGFQFPSDNPAAPVDGYASVVVPAAAA